MPENNEVTLRILDFETRYAQRPTFDEEGNTTGSEMIAEDWVKYGSAQDIQRTQTWDRVKHLQPPKSTDGLNGHEDTKNMRYAFMKQRWDKIEPAYKAWKEGFELPEQGTPLGAWPGINKSQADAFRRAAIRSVEDVAALTDSGMRRVQLPGIQNLVNQAKAFLESSDQAAMAQQVTAQAEKMAAMEEQNKVLSERLDAAMALLEKQAEKPRRGRPPKVKQETEE